MEDSNNFRGVAIGSLPMLTHIPENINETHRTTRNKMNSRKLNDN